MKHALLIITLTCLVATAFGQSLQTFSSAGTAVAAAKPGDKLIVFFMASPGDAEQAKIFQAVRSELQDKGNEFVLVTCSSAVAANQDLFTSRFGEDISQLPIAVVSDASGKKLISQGGKLASPYSKMLIKARIESGKVTDEKELAALERELRKIRIADGEIEEPTGFLGPMTEDLKQSKIAITEVRTWTRKDGGTFRAALLEAKGDRGDFVDEAGKVDTVLFNNLSQTDIAFLQGVLSGG